MNDEKLYWLKCESSLSEKLIESWHEQFASEIDVKHSTVFRLILKSYFKGFLSIKLI